MFSHFLLSSWIPCQSAESMIKWCSKFWDVIQNFNVNKYYVLFSHFRFCSLVLALARFIQNAFFPRLLLFSLLPKPEFHVIVFFFSFSPFDCHVELMIIIYYRYLHSLMWRRVAQLHSDRWLFAIYPISVLYWRLDGELTTLHEIYTDFWAKATNCNFGFDMPLLIHLTLMRVCVSQFLFGSAHIMKQPGFLQYCELAFSECGGAVKDYIVEQEVLCSFTILFCPLLMHWTNTNLCLLFLSFKISCEISSNPLSLAGKSMR